MGGRGNHVQVGGRFRVLKWGGLNGLLDGLTRLP